MTDSNLVVWIIVALAAVGVLVAIGLAFAGRGRRRTAALRARFGGEYERVVDQHGRTQGERLLAERLERVHHMRFRELSAPDRARFTEAWTAIQTQFVDDPGGAVRRANELIKDLMRARGYSADEGFEQRAADLSVDHPDVVQHYRAARALAMGPTEPGLGTEELRQAIVHYRALFADLLQPEHGASHALRPSHA